MITPAAVSDYSDAQVCQSCHSSHITCAVLRSSCLGACVTRVRDEPGGGPPPDPPRWAVHTSSLSLCVTFTTVETLRLPVRGRVLVLLTARGKSKSRTEREHPHTCMCCSTCHHLSPPAGFTASEKISCVVIRPTTRDRTGKR